MIPQSAALPALDPGALRAQVVHTMGDGLTEALRGRVGDDLADIEAEAVAWLERSGHAYYGHTMVGPAGGVYELAPEDRQCHHAVSLGAVYDDAGWRRWAKPLGEAWQEHGRDPDVVYDWWIARWPRLVTPLDLPAGRRPNETTLAIDLLPAPGGGYTAIQLQVAHEVLRERARRHDLPFDRRHVLGHEDVDPCRRGVVRRRGKVLGVPWDPGPQFWAEVPL